MCFNVMDLSRYMTAFIKLFQRFYYYQIGRRCLILLRAGRNFKAIIGYLISWFVANIR